MLSIVIADDEPDIIQLVKMLIEYPDAEVIGQASNSEELFEKIGELNPNTVITDICMPGISGLELIEKAREVYPDVNFIVMSGFAEFEYAQQAVRLGVVDYLLKPVSQSDLNRILKKLDEKLLEENEKENSRRDNNEKLQESVGILRERYISDIWESNNSSFKLTNADEKQAESLKDRYIQAVFFCVDSRFSAQKVDAQMLMQKAEALIAQAEEIENELGVESVFSHFDTYCINLVIYNNDTANETGRVLRDRISDALRSYNHQNGFARVSAAASTISVAGDRANTLRILAQAYTASKWRLEKTDSSVILWNYEEAFMLEKVPGADFSDGILSEAIDGNDEEKIRGAVLRILSQAKDNIPGARYKLIEETIKYINKILSDKHGAQDMEEPLRIEMFEVLSGAGTASEIADRTAYLVFRELKRYDDYFRQKENSVILQAKKYIQEHYSEDISLDIVARHVCLNASYLSALFKTETGQGFSRYLQKSRVEAAKKLLKNTKMRIEDIAQSVGYRDVKSFNKVFINETKVKPSEYRKFYA